MNVSVLEQYQKLASTNRNILYGKKAKYDKIQPASKLHLMQAVIESFVDGILVVTTQGELVHANERARCICQQLTSQIDKGQIPKEIRRICQSLSENCKLFPNTKISMESEIEINTEAKIRIRVRCLQPHESGDNYLLVTLEDSEQTNRSMAISEAKKYDLTERESQVWLLRRANYSYQKIADELYITINTVKKHLKNIYAKQQLSVVSEK